MNRVILIGYLFLAQLTCVFRAVQELFHKLVYLHGAPPCFATRANSPSFTGDPLLPAPLTE